MKSWNDFEIGKIYYLTTSFDYEDEKGQTHSSPTNQKVKVEYKGEYGLGLICVDGELDGHDFELLYHNYPNELLSEAEYEIINGDIVMKVKEIQARYNCLFVEGNPSKDEMFLMLNYDMPKLLSIIKTFIS